MDSTIKDLHRFTLRQSLLLGHIFGSLALIKKTIRQGQDVSPMIDDLFAMLVNRIDDLYYKDREQ